jgi:shikimate kinase/3-dehydroquinate synthase
MSLGDSDNVILTGFMGTGKSSVGQEIARRLDREFVDMDALIEDREGMTVAEVFRQEGEAHFRRLEAALCRELAARPSRTAGRTEQDKGLVIATGGGALIPPDNRDILDASGPVVCLTATTDEILRRLETVSDRPLLEVPDRRDEIEALLEERSEAYRDIPLRVDTTGAPLSKVVDQVLSIVDTPSTRAMEVQYPGGAYRILLGRGLISQVGSLLQEQGLEGQMALVTNATVCELYAFAVLESLATAGSVTAVCSVADGEAHKTLETVRWLYDRFIDEGLDRRSTVLALGGGVVGDMAGFAAATYLRGVRFVQVPTTLLAMVDSSAGGKVAVDHPRGKNLIGAFKQPVLVIADPETLATLPAREFSNGLAEVIKTGLIGDPELFGQIEDHGPFPVAWIIERALRVKVRVVEADPYELGQRATLNLGHTFGHALEQLSNYELSHGEAVGIGLVAAARLSARMGICDGSLPARVEKVLARSSLPVRYQNFSPVQVWEAMATDKKRQGKRRRFILIRGIGNTFVTDQVRQEDALSVLEELRQR